MTPEQIDRELTRNSNKAGQVVHWLDTPITMTEGAIATDPFANAFDGREWWKKFDLDKAIASLKRSELGRRSYARDSAEPTDRLKLGKLAGLRFYFSQLRPDERVDLKVVLPLLQAIEEQ